MNEGHPGKSVTTREVALAANCNQSTVSRALRGDERISPAVRSRIREVADRMGYRPNPFVSALTEQVRGYRHAPRPASIALLNLHRADDQPPFLQRYAEGAIHRANAMGFNVETLHYGQFDHDAAQLARVLGNRGMRGLLILPVPGYEDLRDLRVEDLACVTIDLANRTPPIHRAVPDYFRNAQMAAEELDARGFKRIGFCTKAAEQTGFGRYALAAFLYWQQSLPLTRRLPPHVDPAIAIDHARDRASFALWIERSRPDAILSNDDVYLVWMRELGVAIPEDTAFASLGLERETPEIAGVDQRQELVGSAAMDLVVGQIYRNEYGTPDPVKTVFVQGVWRDGGTVLRSKH